MPTRSLGLITDVAEKARLKKQVSAQIPRDTFVVLQVKREVAIDTVLTKLGLSETTWEDSKVKYMKLASKAL